MHWSVPREWVGETVFIICGGPSVRDQNVEALRGRRVIVVNSSWELAPWADVLYFGDTRWGEEHRERVKAEFKGLVVTSSPNHVDDAFLQLQKVSHPPALGRHPSQVVMGRTSTQGAINIAVHYGAKRIVLLGADMQAVDGVTHHHAPHKWPVNLGCWEKQMNTLRMTGPLLELMGVEVLNASQISLIDWWPKINLDEFLRDNP